MRLDTEGLAVMRELAAQFWPGPLTLVAKACPELPPAVTAGTGFVGVRCPAHARATELLVAAGVPVAAYLCPNLGHGLDDMCIQLGMEFLAEMFGVDVLSVAGMTP